MKAITMILLALFLVACQNNIKTGAIIQQKVQDGYIEYGFRGVVIENNEITGFLEPGSKYNSNDTLVCQVFESQFFETYNTTITLQNQSQLKTAINVSLRPVMSNVSLVALVTDFGCDDKKTHDYINDAVKSVIEQTLQEKNVTSKGFEQTLKNNMKTWFSQSYFIMESANHFNYNITG